MSDCTTSACRAHPFLQASEVYVWVQAVNADCPLAYTTIKSSPVTVDLKPPSTRPVYNTMYFASVLLQSSTDTFGYAASVGC